MNSILTIGEGAVYMSMGCTSVFSRCLPRYFIIIILLFVGTYWNVSSLIGAAEMVMFSDVD